MLRDVRYRYSLQWNGTHVASLSQTNKFSIGAQAVQLCPFMSRDSVHVFACCDRPAVFYGQSGKIMYSNVGAKDVHHMCGFSAVDFPGCLAMASPSTLTIGLIDEVQRLHVRTFPLGEHARRIVYGHPFIQCKCVTLFVVTLFACMRHTPRHTLWLSCTWRATTTTTTHFN